MVTKADLPKGYKQTEIGVIPEEWETSELGGIADVKTGPFGSSLHEKDYVSDGTPIITVEHLSEWGIVHENLPYVSDHDKKRLKAYLLKTGDIVFSRVGSVDRNSLIKEIENEWLFSGRLLRIRPTSPNINSAYLSYHFHFEPTKQRIRSIAVGQTMASLNTKLMKAVLIALPKTETEQQAIAEALDDVGELISSLDKLIAKKQQIKQGTMHLLLEPQVGWEVKKLVEVADISKGEQLNREAMTENDTFPVLNGGVSPSGYTDKWNTDAETIIISEGGNSCGFVNFIKTKFWRGGHCYKVETTINKEFLFYLLKFREKAIMGLRVGSGLPNIQRDRLISFEIIIPKLETQKCIAQVLSDMDSEIESFEQKRDKYKDIKQGMMQELLTGKTRLV